MGAERLIEERRGAMASRLGLVGAFAALAVLTGCHAGTSATEPPRAVAVGKHLQVVRAMTMAERTAIVARFRERNVGPEAWSFNEDALEGVVVVDPFRGFLRRAQRAHTPTAHGVSPEDAATAARTFVEKNADLLGLPAAVVHALAEDRSSAGSQWRIKLSALYPSKGYEAFHEVDNQVDLEVLVADDGVVTAFVNRSRIHPALLLDLHPQLAPDSPAVVQKLLGREFYAALAPADDAAAVRAARVPVGVVRAGDVTKVELTVYASPGPQLAYVTYQLGYLVVGGRPSTFDPLRTASIFMFGFVVDADSGDVLAENVRDVPAAEDNVP